MEGHFVDRFDFTLKKYFYLFFLVHFSIFSIKTCLLNQSLPRTIAEKMPFKFSKT